MNHAPLNGLQISISLDATSVLTPHPITLRFRNVSSQDMNVLPGAGCSQPNTISVALEVTDSSGNSTRLEYFDAEVCAGVGGIFTVEIPAGATAFRTIELARYRNLSDRTKPFELKWDDGEVYAVQAELVGRGICSYQPLPPVTHANTNANALKDCWEGTVTSKKLEIHFPAAQTQ